MQLVSSSGYISFYDRWFRAVRNQTRQLYKCIIKISILY